jgi:nitrate reductase molybdenum cofactor assembly chaperone NarJ/NarW
MDDHRIVHQVASLCLDYPDQSLLERLPLLRDALAEQPAAAVDGLPTLLDHLAGRPLEELQRGYVEVFDMSRKHTLYLSYWTDGDTRRRGEVLGRFKAEYRRSGFLVDTRGELPDYLPMVLEFAAVADPAAGQRLLEEYRPSLELIRLSLEELGTPYAGAVSAVCATLPGPSPADRAAVMAMAAGPPAESVGLEPRDPRLLPLHEVGGHS